MTTKDIREELKSEEFIDRQQELQERFQRAVKWCQAGKVPRVSDDHEHTKVVAEAMGRATSVETHKGRALGAFKMHLALEQETGELREPLEPIFEVLDFLGLAHMSDYIADEAKVPRDGLAKVFKLDMLVTTLETVLWMELEENEDESDVDEDGSLSPEDVEKVLNDAIRAIVEMVESKYLTLLAVHNEFYGDTSRYIR